jgi:exoribonuclease II
LLMNRNEKIGVIRDFVPHLEKLIEGLSDEQLTTAYNAPEWTIAQNVHHLVDSHANSYIRFKLIVTQDNPTLVGYNQVAWAELPDAKDASIEDSLLILRGLHARWARFLSSITDWSRSGSHTESGRLTLDRLLDTYANHCEAHLKQIREVIDKMPVR